MHAKGEFQTTHWTVVLEAGQGDCPKAHLALAELCQSYWYPLYAYVRRRGYAESEAEDLTQEFFLRLLRKDALAGLRREGGRFRSYLLTALKHFLANEWARAQRQKRGGGQMHFSIDADDAQLRYEKEPENTTTPESLFERRWALTLLEEVRQQLRDDYGRAGKALLFEQLQVFLSGDSDQIAYEPLGQQLGMSAAAVKVAVHRLRKRYGQLLRQEISRTVATDDEIEDEIRHLIAVTRRM